ncbi:MAG: D-alanine--D-alanine ligase family protein [Phycisphaerales bacterium]
MSKTAAYRAPRRLRIIVLMHEDLVPPATLVGFSDEEIAAWKTEFDVVSCLEDIGHDVRPLGVHADLQIIRDTIDDFKPHIIFNLLEEFHGVAAYNYSVVSYLELLRQPYTGCNPRGLLLARDKALSKKVLSYHRIPTPGFAVFPVGRKIHRPARLQFPLLVKSLIEEASLGIAQASIVYSDEKLSERVRFIHEHVGTDALVEHYIDGREFYVGVLGNTRLKTLPVWELHFDSLPEGAPRIATEKVKWNYAYQKKIGLRTQAVEDVDSESVKAIERLCKRTYRTLNLSGYARMDLRMDADGNVFVLEANPNPQLSFGEDFAESASHAGMSYESLLQRILSIGLSYRPLWQVRGE